jgi:hypothetical protein
MKSLKKPKVPEDFFIPTFGGITPALSNRKNWRLAYSFVSEYQNLWNEWDSLNPEQKLTIERRYEYNANAQALVRLKNGSKHEVSGTL